jgi:hypothetical protein
MVVSRIIGARRPLAVSESGRFDACDGPNEAIDASIVAIDAFIGAIDAFIDRVVAFINPVDAFVNRVDAFVNRVDAFVDRVDATGILVLVAARARGSPCNLSEASINPLKGKDMRAKQALEVALKRSIASPVK